MISRISFFRTICCILIIQTVLSCKKENSAPNLTEIPTNLKKEEILFVGNSHTYFNRGIAFHLAKFRSNDNLGFTPVISEVAKGGYTLQDHLNDQQTLNKLMETNWDVIILQENTSVAAEELDETFEAIIGLNDIVARKGTKVLLFMTWPYEDQPQMLSPIRRTYARASIQINGSVVKVGENWNSISQDNSLGISLYNEDSIHPSLEGTFYATAYFYKAIYDKAPSNNTYEGGLPPLVATYLKEKVD